MIAWAVETAIATTLLMVLVLAIRKPVREAMGPRFAYLLWALPALRMLLPPLPEGLRHSAAAPIASATESIRIYVVTPVVSASSAPVEAAAGSGVAWTSILLAAWLIGTVGFLGYHAVAHSRFCQRLIRRSRRTHAVAEGRVQVLETDAATGPLAFGILRKYVAFPKDFAERYDVSERDLALAHELCHHQRGDLYANWAALVMLAFHWFNPIAWRAYRAFRADQETACDAVVLAGRPQTLRHAYGLAIVKSAHGGAVSAACHLHTINDLKGRLKMLSKNHKNSRRRLAAGVAGLAGLTVAALGVTASGTSAAATLRSNVEDSIGVRLADLDLPKPPAAPAAPAATAAPRSPAVPQDAAPPTAPVPVAEPAPPAAPEAEARRFEQLAIDQRAIAKRARADAERMRIDADRIRAEALANVPDIRDAKCGPGAGGDTQVVETRAGDGRKTVMVICTDRIEKMARAAQASAMTSKAAAMKSAMAGLHAARASIESEPRLTDAERADALAGIDEAMAEMHAEMTDTD